MTDLECPWPPYQPKAGRKAAAIHPNALLWIVGIAVECEHDDLLDAIEAAEASAEPMTEEESHSEKRPNGAQLNSVQLNLVSNGAALSSEQPAGDGAGDKALGSAAVANALADVYAALGTGPGGVAMGNAATHCEGMAEVAELIACWGAAREAKGEAALRVSPTSSGKQQRIGGFSNPFLPAQAMPKDLSMFPLGFSSGDATVDRCATVLRMLYLRDLRVLQDGINDILETAQQYTANPKTDARLGKVGRG